jgi:hypothetical protein
MNQAVRWASPNGFGAINSKQEMVVGRLKHRGRRVPIPTIADQDSTRLT